MPNYHVSHEITERIEFALMPDSKRQPPSWFRDAEHLAHGGKWIRKEHDAEPAYNGVKRISREWQRIRCALAKLDVFNAASICLVSSSLNHFSHSICAGHGSCRSNCFCDSE